MVKPWRYATGEFALGLPGTVIGAYMLYYYNHNLGLAVGYVTIAKIIQAIWDGINDPMVGHLSDRTRSRWGRRRPWLTVGAIFYLIFSVAAFLVPGGIKGGALFAYYLTLSLLWETAATVAWIPYHSLLPELFPTEASRLHAQTYKKSVTMIAQIVGFVATPILIEMMDYVYVSAIYCVLSTITLVVLLYGLREPEVAPLAKDEPGFFESVAATVHHLTYRYYLIVHGCFHLTLAILMGAMAFYADYSLGLKGFAVSAFFGSVFLATIPGLWLWASAARRLGTPRALSISLACFAVSIGLLTVVPNLVTGIAAGVAIGLSMSGFFVAADVIISRIADTDYARTGRKREGMFFSVPWVITRCANVLQAGAFLLLYYLFGYSSGEAPGPNPGGAFRFLMGVMPFVGLSLAFVASLGLSRAFRREEAYVQTAKAAGTGALGD
ncbi:MAG: Na+/melibiose symporter-like transporter [Symbiobacteriaceae bacterium]|nr:Na+/melibiose symporter-like transporter [Symbiobacteriaceae bacterium]